MQSKTKQALHNGRATTTLEKSRSAHVVSESVDLRVPKAYMSFGGASHRPLAVQADRGQCAPKGGSTAVSVCSQVRRRTFGFWPSVKVKDIVHTRPSAPTAEADCPSQPNTMFGGGKQNMTQQRASTYGVKRETMSV